MELTKIKNKGGAPVMYTYELLSPKVDKWFDHAEKQVFNKTIFDQKAGEQKTITLKKPMTVQAFVLFLGIHKQTFYDIVNDTDYRVYDKQLVDLFMCVHDTIQDNQIAGAILNEYNAQIVSRINGLTDTLNVQQTVSINSLPMHLDNNIIDLTSSDFTILNENVNESGLQLTE